MFHREDPRAQRENNVINAGRDKRGQHKSAIEREISGDGRREVSRTLKSSRAAASFGTWKREFSASEFSSRIIRARAPIVARDLEILFPKSRKLPASLQPTVKLKFVCNAKCRRVSKFTGVFASLLADPI